MYFKAWLGAVFLGTALGSVGVVHLARAQPPAVPAPPSAAIKIVRAEAPKTQNDNDELKAAVSNSIGRLGTLDANKRRIFDEEVVPHYQRFIKNYQRTASGLVVDIDFETIKNYLRFYAPNVMKKPKQASKEIGKEYRALVYLKADPACAKCLAAIGAIKEFARQRMEARGFYPIFLSADEFKGGAVVEQALDEKVQEQFSRQQASAALCIQWRLTPEEEIDSVHADEKHYQIQSMLLVRDFPKMSGKLELLDTDDFSTSAQRLLTDQLAELGAQTALAQAEQVDTGKEEITLTIAGLKDFTALNDAKALLQARMGSNGIIEQRKISSSQVVFAVKTPRSLAEVKKIFSGVPFNMEIQ